MFTPEDAAVPWLVGLNLIGWVAVGTIVALVLLFVFGCVLAIYRKFIKSTSHQEDQDMYDDIRASARALVVEKSTEQKALFLDSVNWALNEVKSYKDAPRPKSWGKRK